MTVKELKKALRGVPENIPVSILVDGYDVQRREPWMGHHDVTDDENGQEVETFTINC
jgi:hypothetical protein